MGKKSGSGSRMNNPDHISESLEKFLRVKILKFFDANPGWKKFGSGIRVKHPGSAKTLNKIAVVVLRWRMRTLRRRGRRSSCTEQRRTCPSTTGGTSRRRKAQK
jgi:hypothetical protein